MDNFMPFFNPNIKSTESNRNLNFRQGSFTIFDYLNKKTQES